MENKIERLTTTSSTNDEYENISQILVRHVDINVKMAESRISGTTIGSRGLGPCMFFLLDFYFNDAPQCYLYHYSYPIDEQGLSRRKTLLKILFIICETLKEHLAIPSMSPETLVNNTISEFRLLIGGGDKEEGCQIRESFALLNSNEIEIMKIKTNDHDVLYLYEQLLNRTTILQYVTQMMPDNQETAG